MGYLVLGRKVNESIVINENITVTVLSVGKRLIKLGIEAPASVPVDRMEIFIAKCRGDKYDCKTSNDS